MSIQHGERIGELDDDVEYTKPIPVPDAASQPFFDGALRDELMLQRCARCGTWMWPVRVRCISCFSDNLAWTASSGRGTLYSYTLVHQVFHPGFATEIPYNVAQVDLDEGVRIITSIVDLPDDALRIGIPLAVTFERITDEVALPRFRPVEANGE